MSRKRKEKYIAGSSMIEVLVAVLVVMLMVGMFSRVVNVSVTMLNRTEKAIARTEKFNSNYYKTSESKEIVDGKFSLKYQDDSMELSTGLAKYEDSSLSMYSFRDNNE